MEGLRQILVVFRIRDPIDMLHVSSLVLATAAEGQPVRDQARSLTDGPLVAERLHVGHMCLLFG